MLSIVWFVPRKTMALIGGLALVAALGPAPAAARSPGDVVMQMTAGNAHTCGIRGVKAYCWGIGGQGQLGNGGTANQLSPVEVLAPEGVAFTHLAAGYAHTCGIVGTKAYCWGAGDYGRLGNGGTTNQLSPVEVAAPEGVVFTQLAAGNGHTCGIAGTKAYCWGANYLGQLGDGGTANQLTPVEVPAPEGVPFTHLTASGRHTCGIAGTKTYCWGDGSDFQLGNGGMQSQSSPVEVAVPEGVAFTQLAAGVSHTCGISGTKAYCWGGGYQGQLGNGGTGSGLVSLAVAVPEGVAFTQLAAGFQHTCGVTGTKSYCWGDGSNFQLGDGGTANQSSPVEVAAPEGVVFTQLTAGYQHTCGVTGTKAYCWGVGYQGQLGNGGTATQSSPAAVQFPLPSAPLNVKGVAAPSGTTITATWTVPSNLGVGVQGYHVETTLTSRSCDVPATAYQCIYTGLRNGETYRFMVRAAGAGDAGMSVAGVSAPVTLWPVLPRTVPSGVPRLGVSRTSVPAGQSLMVSGNYYKPGTGVTVALYNGATPLRKFYASSSGTFGATILIPAGAGKGVRTLLAAGLGRNNAMRYMTTPITVR